MKDVFSRIAKKCIPASMHYNISNLKKKLFGYSSYSQFGEDTVLQDIFKDVVTGKYIDVGAHHPYRYSNTYLLFKKGWSGVNIDPNPDSIALFNTERPQDTNICAGVGEQDVLIYYQFSDPAVNSFNKQEAEKWMGKDFLTFLGTREIEVRPLRELVEGPIDLLCIDAEGMDREVLTTYDWNHPPLVVVVEGKDSESFLEERGYRLHAECGASYIYIKN